MPLPTYSAFAQSHKGIVREIITDGFVSEVLSGDVYNDDNRIYKTKALWDTGATSSAITPRIVNQLNLSPIGTVNVIFGGGESVKNRFLVDLYLPNNARISGVSVTECDDKTGRRQDGSIYFDIIIGMYLISIGDFAISNNYGISKFSFISPPMHDFDFVRELKEIDKKKYNKAGRNDLCPCGSGKKYKDCHWKIYNP